MSNRSIITWLAIILIVPAMLPGANHKVDLSGNVPLYGQETSIWCGAACGKMIMNGYPNPGDRILYSQQTVWNNIQNNNLTGEPITWATNPVGLRITLNTLNPPPGSWNVYALANRGTVMFEIMYWMNNNNLPVAILVNQGKHWVTVIGYESDIVPQRESATPKLKYITIHDPLPVNKGATSTIAANSWYNTYWNGPICYCGTWYGTYVAVIDPPVGSDTSTFDEEERMTGELIAPQEAEALANNYIQSLHLDEMEPYTMLQDPNTINTDPILVQEDRDLEMEEPQYYIVPFGYIDELPEQGEQFHRLCILVNGHTGAFEEIGVFGDKVRFMPITEAISIAMAELQLDPMQQGQVQAKLVFGPWYIPQTRYWPVWRIKHNGVIVFYIDYDGNIHPVNAPGVAGD